MVVADHLLSSTNVEVYHPVGIVLISTAHTFKFVEEHPAVIDAAVGPYVTTYFFQEASVTVPSSNFASKAPSPKPGVAVLVYSYPELLAQS